MKGLRFLQSRARSRRVAALLLIAATSACAPHIELSETPVLQSTGWSGELDQLAGEQGIEQLGWSAFGSPTLDELINQALRQSPEIGIALARVDQARGELAVTRSALLPTLEADGSVDYSRINAPNAAAIGEDRISGGLSLGYELDLFGRNSAATRADQARLLASGYDAEAVRLLVASNVAQTYFQLLALERRGQILDQAIENSRELQRIIRIRYEEGVATRVELGLQEIEVRNLESEKSSLVEAKAATRNALAILVGEEAPGFAPQVEEIETLAIPGIPQSQPGMLLVRRPDIRANEALIAAANGDVSAARRAFLPTLTIGVGVDGNAVGIGNPLTVGLNAAAGLLAPIFSGGRLRGNLQRAAGSQREIVERYRLSLLTALGEAEDALVSVEQSAIRRELLAQVVQEARLTATLAREQYVGGVADARTVLEAERELLAAEENYTFAYQSSLSAVVDVHRALGGSPEGFAGPSLQAEPVVAQIGYDTVALTDRIAEN